MTPIETTEYSSKDSNISNRNKSTKISSKEQIIITKINISEVSEISKNNFQTHSNSNETQKENNSKIKTHDSTKATECNGSISSKLNNGQDCSTDHPIRTSTPQNQSNIIKKPELAKHQPTCNQNPEQKGPLPKPTQPNELSPKGQNKKACSPKPAQHRKLSPKTQPKKDHSPKPTQHRELSPKGHQQHTY